MKPKFTKKILKKEYLINKLSQSEIAKKYNISQSVVGGYLKKFNIPARSVSEGLKVKNLTSWCKGLTKETDIRIAKYAKKLKNRIFSNEHKQKLRDARKNKPLTDKQLQSILNAGRIGRAKINKDRKGKTYEEYYGLKQAKKIKKKFANRPSSTLGLKIWENKIHPRGMLGKTHSKKTRSKLSLLGGGTGIPFENAEYPEEFNNQLKKEIRRRDNYTCQMSGCNCSQKKNGRKLDVHHIDYDKQNSSKGNLISLCQRCHALTNILLTRKGFQDLFEYMIAMKEIVNKFLIKREADLKAK